MLNEGKVVDGKELLHTLVSQFVEMDTPTALARTPGGNISDGIIQLTQPVQIQVSIYSNSRTGSE
jgi:hypothetical protein